MKCIKEISFFKNEEREKGDVIVSRILEIIRTENIKIEHNGGYTIDLDDKIYVFSDFGSVMGHDCNMSIYNQSQRITQGQYTGVITGKSGTRYKFSYKLWKELEKLYKNQQTPLESDLEDLSDVKRSAKKYNL